MRAPLIAVLLLASAGARAQQRPDGPDIDGNGADRPDEDPLTALLVRGPGLTADEAARRAASSSVEGRAKARAADGAEARREEAAALYWPRLVGTARYTRLSPLAPAVLADPRVSIVGRSGPPGPIMPGDALEAFTFPSLVVPVDQYLTQASLVVPVSDYVLRVSERLAAATHSARAARFEERAARLQAASDARVAYYQWIRARGQGLVAQRSVAQAGDHLRDAGHLFESGVVPRADTLRAESQVKSAELLLLRARNGAALAEERLRVLLHDAEGPPYEIGEDVTASLPPPADNDLAHLLDEALASRFEVRALAQTASAAAELRREARAAGWPRLELFGNAVYANPNPRVFPAQPKFDATWDAGVALTWTPTDLPGARATERERAARESEVAADREALVDGLRLEVSEAWRAVREADLAAETARRGLSVAEEGYRVRRDLFRNGKATFVEVNDAQTDLTRARLALVNAHVDERIARVQLEHAVGRDAHESGPE